MSGFGFGTRPLARRRGSRGPHVTLPASPVNAAPSPVAWFGQDSADNLATDSAAGCRLLTLPAGATMRPADTSDWYIAIWFRTGQWMPNANQETLASSGSTFSSNSAGAAIGMFERGVAGSGMTFAFYLNNANSRDLLQNLTPSPLGMGAMEFGDWCAVMGVSGQKPYVALCRPGAAAPYYRASGDAIGGFNSFYFSTAQYSAATCSLSGGVLTFNQASMTTNYVAGATVYVESGDHPEINGIYTITTRLTGNAGFTVSGVAGTSFATTAANAKVQLVRSATDLLTTIGGLATGTNRQGWSGGVQRLETRWGTMPINAGQIDGDWLRSLAGRSSVLPGSLRYACTMQPGGLVKADPAGSIVTDPVASGTLALAPTMGADWLLFPDGHPDQLFAADLNQAGGSATGTVRLRYTSPYVTGPLTAQVETADGTVLVPPSQVSMGAQADGTGTLSLSGVPCGVGRYLRITATARAGFEMVWGPFAVGPSVAWISQSTINTMFGTIDTGANLAPIPTSTGWISYSGVAGGLADTGNNQSNGPGGNCRLGRIRAVTPAPLGDGMKAFANKLVELQNAVSGTAMAAQTSNLCRSGHPAEAFWADRRVLVNAIGTASAGVALTGSWVPYPNGFWASTVAWTNPAAGKATLYRGGSLALNPATGLYELTGGTAVATNDSAGNWVAIGGSGVSGSFNATTAAFSITDPVGGPLFIAAEMHFDSQGGTTALPRRGLGFTTWGSDGVANTGHIGGLIAQMPRQTAFCYTWANYLLSWAGTHSQADVNAKVAMDIGLIRKRIEENYPVHADTPWVIFADPRTTSTNHFSEHKIRLALRAYALATPNTHWSIGPITGEMAGLSNPHPGTAASSGQLWGVTLAHGLAKVLGYPGAKADEIHIISAARAADGSYVDLTFNNPAGTSLTCSDPTKIEGIFSGSSNDVYQLTNLDVKNGAYVTSIIAYNKVRVSKASGTFLPGTWWNTNIGWILTDTTLVAENTRLAQTLSLDNGGYNGIRPGQPVSFNPNHVAAS